MCTLINQRCRENSEYKVTHIYKESQGGLKMFVIPLVFKGMRIQRKRTDEAVVKVAEPIQVK